MKQKSSSILVLALVCMLVLSGCACEHQWQEADCLNAKVCTKCEETEGEPLGHDWAEATCAAPETCTRCGETLPHTYGEWVMGEDEMTRTCTGCGDEESAEIDRELYLMQKLEGHWDFYAEQGSDYMHIASQIGDDVQTISLHIDQENGSWLRNPIGAPDIFEIIVDYVEYEEIEGTGMYTFTVTLTSDNSRLGMLYTEAEGEGMILFGNGSSTIFLTKNDDLVPIFTGLWAEVEGDAISTLELKEDRTFTADIVGETFSGTWHLRGLSYYTVSYGGDATYQQAKVDLVYEQDGKAVVKTSTLSLGEQGQDPAEYTRYGASLDLFLTEDHHNVEKMEPEALEKLKDANTNGAQEILGKWESTHLNTYNNSTSSSSGTEVTDYSITFAEDGTFTAILDKDYAGTWRFDSANLSYDSFYYTYYLKFDGVREEIYTSIGDKGELHFSESDSSGSRSLYFAQLTEEEKAALVQTKAEAAQKILGTWTSLTVSTYENGVDSEFNDTSNIFTFNEDGTFTTNLESLPAGTWTAGDIDVYQGEGYTHTTYSFDIEAEGFNDSLYARVSQDGDLIFTTYQDGVSIIYQCGQYTEEELAMFADAPNRIVGTWSGSEITQYNEAADTMEVVRKENHTITVNADGTYTSTLPGLSGGTWTFWKMDNRGLAYSFQQEDGGLIFYINGDGVLEAWFRENDNDEYVMSIDMNKE